MKKALFLAVLAALMVSLFSGVATVLADEDENLKKVGQQALAVREEILLQKEAEINAAIFAAADDGVIQTKEMAELWKRVSDFWGAKRKYDGELADYGLRTNTLLKDSRLGDDRNDDSTIWNYFSSNSLFKEDVGGRVREFFAAKTGKDVIVMSGAVFDAPALLPLVSASILFVVGMFCLLVGYIALNEEGLVGATILFALTAFFLIALFLW